MVVAGSNSVEIRGRIGYLRGMQPFLAHTPKVAGYFLLGGGLIYVVGYFWFLVVAGRRDVRWLLGLLLMPLVVELLPRSALNVHAVQLAVVVIPILVELFFFFVENKAVNPWLLKLAGLGVVFWGVYAVDAPDAADLSMLEKLDVVCDGLKIKRVSGETLETRKAMIRARQQELEKKRAALKPNDEAEQAAFARELRDYLFELQKVKDEMARVAPPSSNPETDGR